MEVTTKHCHIICVIFLIIGCFEVCWFAYWTSDAAACTIQADACSMGLAMPAASLCIGIIIMVLGVLLYQAVHTERDGNRKLFLIWFVTLSFVLLGHVVLTGIWLAAGFDVLVSESRTGVHVLNLSLILGFLHFFCAIALGVSFGFVLKYWRTNREGLGGAALGYGKQGTLSSQGPPSTAPSATFQILGKLPSR